MIQLRPFQKDIVTQTGAALRRGLSVLIQLPTGGGKTVLAAFMIQAYSDQGMRCFFICHRSELILQTAKTFSQIGLKFGFIASGWPENPRANIQICSMGTLKNRLGKTEDPEFIITDEAHHCIAGVWSKVKNYYSDAAHVGLSATPRRLDGKGLGSHYDYMVKGPPVRQLIEAGYLSDFKYYAPSEPDLSAVRVLGGDYNKGNLNDVVDTPTLTGDVVAHWKKIAYGKRTLLFGVSRKHSEHMAQSFRDVGIPWMHLDGKTPQNIRRNASIILAKGELMGLSNVGLFGEGYDLSAQAGMDVPVECVIDCQPTLSLSKFLQMVGRGLRPKPEPAILLDHSGNWKRHGFPDDERDWSLDGDVKQTKKKSEQVNILATQCPGCFAVHRPKPECPECGHVYEIKHREVEEQEGTLEEIDREAVRRRKKREQSACKSLEELQELGEKRGYKKGWARFIWKARANRGARV